MPWSDGLLDFLVCGVWSYGMESRWKMNWCMLPYMNIARISTL
jgi:hypothetical protein